MDHRLKITIGIVIAGITAAILRMLYRAGKKAARKILYRDICSKIIHYKKSNPKGVTQTKRFEEEYILFTKRVDTTLGFMFIADLGSKYRTEVSFTKRTNPRPQKSNSLVSYEITSCILYCNTEKLATLIMDDLTDCSIDWIKDQRIEKIQGS